jgi:hypothetical protein
MHIRNEKHTLYIHHHIVKAVNTLMICNVYMMCTTKLSVIQEHILVVYLIFSNNTVQVNLQNDVIIDGFATNKYYFIIRHK